MALVECRLKKRTGKREGNWHAVGRRCQCGGEGVVSGKLWCARAESGICAQGPALAQLRTGSWKTIGFGGALATRSPTGRNRGDPARKLQLQPVSVLGELTIGRGDVLQKSRRGCRPLQRLWRTDCRVVRHCRSPQAGEWTRTPDHLVRSHTNEFSISTKIVTCVACCNRKPDVTR